jgi:hypothetical protein
VVAVTVASWRGDERGEPLKEFERAERQGEVWTLDKHTFTLAQGTFRSAAAISAGSNTRPGSSWPSNGRATLATTDAI